VMSFNVRYGTADDGENRWADRRELVFEVIRRHGPDVVGLQEALDWQLDEIRTALPQYGVIGVGRDDGKRAGEFAAILFVAERFEVAEQGTFWLSDAPEVAGSRSWGNVLPRICTWGRFVDTKSGRGFYVYNLHLSHVSQVSRQRSVDLLAGRIGQRTPADPVVVVGDFNAGEDDATVRYLTGRQARIGVEGTAGVASPGLVDTFRALHPETDEAGTYHGFAGGTAGARVDYVFAPPEAEVLEAAILRDGRDRRYPSDHFPVMARLRLVL
jgi:endonuclease/exonuclease/phosphatase family metal-dependent hydrolase